MPHMKRTPVHPNPEPNIKMPKEGKKESRSISLPSHVKKHYGGLIRILHRRPVSEALIMMRDGTPIELNENAGFFEGLSVLLDNRIQSAPIKNSDGTYVAFIDTLHMVKATVDMVSKCKMEAFEGGDKEDKEILQESLVSENLSSKKALDFGIRDMGIVVEDDALIDAIEKLSVSKCHRLAVRSASEAQKFVGVLTQSGMCEYLLEEHPVLVDKCHITVSDILSGISDKDVVGHPVRDVISVTPDVSTFEALKLMSQKGISGVAVVNSEGVLINVFSSSDLNLWTELRTFGDVFRFRNFGSLDRPLSEFMEDNKSNGKLFDTAPTHPLCCSFDTVIVDLLSQLLENNVHRLFVVDPAGKPINVISYGDILSYLRALERERSMSPKKNSPPMSTNAR